MRVVVVGATGNVGTALLRALQADPAFGGVVGVARRYPDRAQAPYAGVDWHLVDVAHQDGDAVRDRLVDAFTGAEAVVHLVWAIQPNKRREYMRRVNVDGTRRVAEAAARAGVDHLVVASSVAVYSPVQDDIPRTEAASRNGIPSSHYSVDKAAQERMLDELEAKHPELAVARMRTALVFQADAGAQIQRYFLGPLVPARLLRERGLPVVPLPAGLRLQIVHAEDAASAYTAVLRERARGAFNVAASDTLWPQDLARILDHGRHVEVSALAIRPFVHYAWRAGLVAADAGWLDMAMGVPLMDSSRVRELGWSECRTAEQALSELLTGLRERRGTGSAPLRPGEGSADRHDAAGSSAVATGSEGFSALPAELIGANIPDRVDAALLGLYLSDHLSGATAGMERIQRMADDFGDTPWGGELVTIRDEIVTERELLRELVSVLGVRRRPSRQALGWLAEHVGRLKLNRRLVTTSPITPLLELELMRSAVNGKVGLWQTLRALAADLGVAPEPFVELTDLARSQATRLERLHAQIRRISFLVDRDDETPA